jgi:iron complex transport system permease protein
MLRARRAAVLQVALLLVLVGAMTWSATVGAVAIPVAKTVADALRATAQERTDLLQTGPLAILWSIRLPRVVFAGLVGGALGMAGAALQGVFRNPLADPGLIGVSSGAALAAALTIVLGHAMWASATPTLTIWVLPLAAFVGALAAVALLLLAARGRAVGAVTTMLLCGIALNALVAAATSVLTLIATDSQLRSLSFWLLGSMGGATWHTLAALAPPIALALCVLPRHARALDALLLGEAEARHVGIDVTRVTRHIIALAALAVGAAVAFAGLIGFVGLVVPHGMRLLIGPSHAALLRASALGGAVLLIAADTVGRTVVAPIEVPVGVVTALLGAPLFLWFVGFRTRGVEQVS